MDKGRVCKVTVYVKHAFETLSLCFIESKLKTTMVYKCMNH